MRTQLCSFPVRFGLSSLRLVASLAALVVGFSGLAAARAGVTLVYSFEGGDIQGFANNFAAPEGVNNEVAVDTIGATEGTGSLKFAMVTEEFFAGVLTSQLDPAIENPPGVDFVLFDLTIPQAFVGPGFARTSVTVFGSHPEVGAIDAQDAQFLANEVPLDNLPAGTHQIRINLSSAAAFPNFSFNQLFGPPIDGTPTGFQIYINKSVTVPFTVYFDNIRVGEYNADFNNDGNVDGQDYNTWKTNFGTGTAADADGDGDSDGQDFLVWQRQFGATGLNGAAAVPEPATAALVGTALAALAAAARTRCRRA
jgi:hypothetical protein